MFKEFVRAIPLAACLTLAYGQTDNSVTVTATRTVNAQPDQASFTITVTTPMTASLDDVLAAVQGTGLTAANLVSVSTPSFGISVLTPMQTPPAPTLAWTFAITTPFSRIKDAYAALGGLPAAVRQKNQAFTAAFAFSGATASQAALDDARLRLLPDLINDARAKAKQPTDAAGLGLGGIIGMTEIGTTFGSTPASTPAVIPIGTPSGLPSFLLAAVSTPTPPPTIALSVKFTLLRFTSP